MPMKPFVPAEIEELWTYTPIECEHTYSIRYHILSRKHTIDGYNILNVWGKKEER